MKNQVFYGLFVAYVFAYYFTYSAQEKFTLSGTISEEKSNETLIGVNILFPEISSWYNHQ